MLELRFIRENADAIRAGAKKKRIPVDLDRLLELDAQSRTVATRADEIRALLNSRGKEIARLSPEERSRAGAELNTLKDELKGLEESQKALAPQVRDLQLRVPNIPADDVPEGKDDTENVERRRVGEVPKFDFEPLDHVEL